MADIIHKGTIKKVDDGKVTLLLDTDKEDCAGCAISAMCTKGTELVIDCPGATPDMVGRKVKVAIGSGLRARAVAFYLLIPVLLLTGVLIAVIWWGGGDLLACSASLGVLAVWYALVYLMRRRIDSAPNIRII